MIMLGLALFLIAATHATEVWQSLGTDRIRVGVGLIMAPLFGVPVLSLGAMLLRLAWTGGPGDKRWGKWLPIMFGVALLSIPVTLALDPVAAWRLRSHAFRRCDDGTAGRYITWSEWVKGSGACEE